MERTSNIRNDSPALSGYKHEAAVDRFFLFSAGHSGSDSHFADWSKCKPKNLVSVTVLICPARDTSVR